MSNFEYVTASFESKLLKNTAIVHLKSQALEIFTDPGKNIDFYNLLKSVNDSPGLRGYVQINDTQFDSHSAVDAMAAGARSTTSTIWATVGSVRSAS